MSAINLSFTWSVSRETKGGIVWNIIEPRNSQLELFEIQLEKYIELSHRSNYCREIKSPDGAKNSWRVYKGDPLSHSFSLCDGTRAKCRTLRTKRNCDEVALGATVSRKFGTYLSRRTCTLRGAHPCGGWVSGDDEQRGTKLSTSTSTRKLLLPDL